MGALLAYQLTCRLHHDEGPLPAWMGVSAYGNPRDAGDSDARPHFMSDGELRRWLRDVGGSTPQLVDDESVWSTFAPVFRNDFKLLDTWTSSRSPGALPIPLVAFGGSSDELASEESLLSWQTSTTHFRGLHRYDGDHFYLMSHQQHLAAVVTAAMRSATA